jgi:two-component system sensor histidine kinase HydH
MVGFEGKGIVKSNQKHTDNSDTAHDEAVQMMAGWVSAIADQVKNPVAGLSAAAGLIEKQMAAFRAEQSWDPAIVEEAVRLMILRLNRFDQYLSELSGFTREVQLDVKSWSIAEQWNSIEQAIVRRIPLDFRLIPNIPAALCIDADLERVTSALGSLVFNSVESTSRHVHPVIEVSFCQFHDQQSQVDGVSIVVLDNGSGFMPSALENALEPFFTTKDAGTGLGLAMVQKYVKAHGGWIKLGHRVMVDQQPGAMVQLFFPRQRQV